jgi:hypothetical protein
MGLFWYRLTNTYWRKLVMQEIISRSAKNTIKYDPKELPSAEVIR